METKRVLTAAHSLAPLAIRQTNLRSVTDLVLTSSDELSKEVQIRVGLASREIWPSEKELQGPELQKS